MLASLTSKRCTEVLFNVSFIFNETNPRMKRIKQLETEKCACRNKYIMLSAAYSKSRYVG